MLAEVAMVQEDDTAFRRALAEVERLQGVQGYFGWLLKGKRAYRRREWPEARQHVEKALTIRPRDVRLLELLLKLDVIQSRPSSAQRHVREILEIDPGHALANHVMGALHREEGRFALAEDSYRRALERSRTGGTLNDLAWLLYERGDHGEAEALVREALLKTPRAYSVWDTLGVILMETGRAEQAEQAFEKAISLFSEALPAYLHLLRLKVRQGNASEATEILEMLKTRQNRLSPEQQEELRALERELRE
jgi:Tfp pilus assembly protein PilF